MYVTRRAPTQRRHGSRPAAFVRLVADRRRARAGAFERCRPALERSAALVLLVALAPVVAAAALLVRLTSRGPAFYSQRRLGHLGRVFTLYKLRTMVHECERLSGPRWSTPGDPRVTRLGRLLRALHLDELPQLWNVLQGDMSLIGPRPERPEITPVLEENIPFYRDRLAVLPGITGLAQVLLPPDTTLESVTHKLAYDLHYVRAGGAGMDLRILGATLLKLLGLGLLVRRLLLRGAVGTVERRLERATHLPLPRPAFAVPPEAPRRPERWYVRLRLPALARWAGAWEVPRFPAGGETSAGVGLFPVVDSP